jgi:hypothetical protein
MTIRISYALALNTVCCVIAILIVQLIPTAVRGWPFLHDFVREIIRQSSNFAR